MTAPKKATEQLEAQKLEDLVPDGFTTDADGVIVAVDPHPSD